MPYGHSFSKYPHQGGYDPSFSQQAGFFQNHSNENGQGSKSNNKRYRGSHRNHNEDFDSRHNDNDNYNHGNYKNRNYDNGNYNHGNHNNGRYNNDKYNNDKYNNGKPKYRSHKYRYDDYDDKMNHQGSSSHNHHNRGSYWPNKRHREQNSPYSRQPKSFGDKFSQNSNSQDRHHYQYSGSSAPFNGGDRSDYHVSQFIDGYPVKERHGQHFPGHKSGPQNGSNDPFDPTNCDPDSDVGEFMPVDRDGDIKMGNTQDADSWFAYNLELILPPRF